MQGSGIFVFKENLKMLKVHLKVWNKEKEKRKEWY